MTLGAPTAVPREFHIFFSGSPRRRSLPHLSHPTFPDELTKEDQNPISPIRLAGPFPIFHALYKLFYIVYAFGLSSHRVPCHRRL